MPSSRVASSAMPPTTSKKAIAALCSKDGELATSTTTCVPAKALASPSPVTVLTPVDGEAGRTSWPRWRSRATTREPMRPEPPITTIFNDASCRLPPEWRGGQGWPSARGGAVVPVRYQDEAGRAESALALKQSGGARKVGPAAQILVPKFP